MKLKEMDIKDSIETLLATGLFKPLMDNHLCDDGYCVPQHLIFLNSKIKLIKQTVKLPEDPKPLPLPCMSAVDVISIPLSLILKCFKTSLNIEWLSQERQRGAPCCPFL